MFVHDLSEAASVLTERFALGARWIAIDGLGASGKSELAQACLAAGSTAARQLALVCLDDFTRPGSVGWEKQRFVDQVWRPLSLGNLARYQRWHWTSQQPTQWVSIAADSAVLVEGIGASEPPPEVNWDALVWVEAPSELRSLRAEKRDPGRFSCWSQTWRPIEDEWASRVQPWRRADVIVINASERPI